MSPVITYFPVSPVAPPNMTAFFLDTEIKEVTKCHRVSKSRKWNFPEYFNPEVFNAVMKWTRKESNQELIQRASNVVSKKAEQIFKYLSRS